jgi:hypothetical protein
MGEEVYQKTMVEESVAKRQALKHGRMQVMLSNLGLARNI